MFRAVALSIALTLAIGPNTLLLCRAVCDQPQADASDCDHQGPATAASMAGHNRCDDAVPSAAEFLPKDVRRDVSFARGPFATPPIASVLAQPAIDARPGDKPARDWPIDKQRLSTTLRL